MSIFLFTDFGSRDIYVGQVKAVLDREAPDVRVIDLLNDAPAHNIRAAAHLLAALAPECPPESVFLAVVDPGVGGTRAPLVLNADGYRFVGPDNGLLSVFAARSARVDVFRIVWTPRRLTSSFHGRDLFAPVAARVATGTLRPEELTPLPLLGVSFGPEDLAEIIHVDHFGNAITGLRAKLLTRDVRVVVKGEELRFARVFSEVSEGEVFWYENSEGLVEIAASCGSAAQKLGLCIGDAVALM